MRVSTYEETPETRFTALQVISGMQLVVAQLEIFMLFVVLADSNNIIYIVVPLFSFVPYLVPFI